MISKELLSEVLGLKINLVEIDEARNKVFYYCNQFGRMTGEINIYELAYKCKEWTKNKEYWAVSGYDEGYFCMLRDMPDNRFFDASTEIETIFKACTWIMEQNK